MKGRATGCADHTDPVVIRKIADGYKLGLSPRAIAASVGMGRRTLLDWQERGQEELQEWYAHPDTELGSFGRFSAFTESQGYLPFELDNTSVLDAAKRGERVAWQAALAHMRSRNTEWVEQYQGNVQVTSTVVIAAVSLPALAEDQILTILQDSITSGSKLLGPPPLEEIEGDGGKQDS